MSNPTPYHPPLWFLLVGVPKAGTSSLHRALQRHPELTLPRGKETPFFCDPDPSPSRWAHLAREVFPRPWRKLGKLTPQYWYCPDLPDRLARAFPSLRILMLLRHPVERFYSEYAMYYRREALKEPFDSVVQRALDPKRIRMAQQVPWRGEGDPAPYFLLGGLYSEGIRRYQTRFSHVGIFFFEELIQSPENVLTEIQDFLGISRYPLAFPWEHRGGRGGILMETLTRGLAFLRSFAIIRKVGKRVLGTWRHEINWLIETRQVVQTPPPLDEESRERLTTFYQPYVDELAEMLGRKPPWPDLVGG